MEDRTLIRLFLAGDRAASKAIDEYIDAGLQEWKSRVGYQVDDIKSDIRYKIYDILSNDKFEGRSSLRTFLARIVNHTCIDYLRYNRRFSDTPPEDMEIPSLFLNAESKMEKKQFWKLIFRVIRLLPRECIALWRMVLYDDMSCREIAVKKNKTEEYIKWRLWACRNKAREMREIVLKKDQLF